MNQETEDKLDLIERLIKLADKHKVDSLQYADIKVEKKHLPKPVKAAPAKPEKKEPEEPYDFFKDPDLYNQVLDKE